MLNYREMYKQVNLLPVALTLNVCLSYNQDIIVLGRYRQDSLRHNCSEMKKKRNKDKEIKDWSIWSVMSDVYDCPFRCVLHYLKKHILIRHKVRWWWRRSRDDGKGSKLETTDPKQKITNILIYILCCAILVAFEIESMRARCWVDCRRIHTPRCCAAI